LVELPEAVLEEGCGPKVQGRMWQGNYEAITIGVKDLRGEQPGTKSGHRFASF
jgi:hypothetical protein